ncbi:MAG: hypothetical protein COT71_03050 [Candidatus Andersenbacteria bacterium CG10_big_fil_rev_8_21_14_0_10_54_11]|uniref:Polysaccharide biosynthesis protein CapD-like domain-containing protein n=1 Tax=Candidatus Andersenbacteria bacterium CG10_big_fil_rev_8_21_14_0_10_54_11 TaxID=1974485 RepID=A0A2M6WZ17_9BACT|nr:MAG: hypothetical protein COT71_03050 [Candidatus Andersenbacteria bacterium CG10_big_fil_rev_8_21_14_0_10_54_11]
MGSGTQTKVLIIGAGKAGRLLDRDIAARHRNVTVLGFVDDAPDGRADVVGMISDLPMLLQKFQVGELVIALPSADGATIRRILLTVAKSTAEVRMVPREQHVLRHNAVTYAGLREVGPDDFLGRPIVKRNLRTVERFYTDKRVLVTGGAGSIGAEIVQQLLALGVRHVSVYDHSEYACYLLEQFLRERRVGRRRYSIIIGSVTAPAKVAATLRRVRPDIVFHAAAYKHVHLMEDNCDEAVLTNIFGTKTMADAARAEGVRRFVFISTDKVVHPTSVMGASKLLAEHYIQSLPAGRTGFSIVRFGNVINSHGSVLPLFERQIREHRYITLTSMKMRRYFMSIREAAELVILSGTRVTRGDIFVLDMGDLISLKEVATCLIRSKNLRPEIDVRLRVVGRRPGEKMVEELFTERERDRMVRTSLPHVWQLRRSDELPREALQQTLERLQPLAEAGASRRVRAILAESFPSLQR